MVLPFADEQTEQWSGKVSISSGGFYTDMYYRMKCTVLVMKQVLVRCRMLGKEKQGGLLPSFSGTGQ